MSIHMIHFRCIQLKEDASHYKRRQRLATAEQSPLQEVTSLRQSTSDTCIFPDEQEEDYSDLDINEFNEAFGGDPADLD